jgi:Flp pilus assembly protein TadD
MRPPLVLTLLAVGAVLLVVGSALLALDWWICLPEGKAAHYVGRQECARCHQKELDLWAGSDHDRAMAPATPETVLGNFDDQKFTNVPFEKIPSLSESDFRTVADHVQPALWAMALRETNQRLKDQILDAMPEPTKARVIEEMDKLVTVRPCDMAQAQDEIAHAVRGLEESGRVTIDFAVSSRLFRRGEKFFIETDGPDGDMQTFEIKYTFGFRPLQQYLVELPRGRVQCLPIAWNTEKQRWFHVYPGEQIPAGDTLHWTRPLQNWNYMCAECHSTNLEKNYDLASDTYRTTWSEIDVSCETCHGPGSLHVELADSLGVFWDRRIGYGLPRLKDPDPRVEIETCAPCHARRRVMYPDQREGKPLRDHYPLLDCYTPELLDRELYYADGQILEEDYVYGSYIQSKMYQKGVRCTDCHDPHSLRVKYMDADAPWGTVPDNRLCTGCHTNQHPAGKYDTPAHHHHPDPSKPGTKCVECHMPETTYMVADPRRDHSLRNPLPRLTIDLGIPNACNLCHNDRSKGETPEWAQQHVENWYGKRQAPERFAEAIAAGREGRPEGQAALRALTRRKDISPMVRASGVALLGRYPSEGGHAAVLRGLEDPEALVRTAAVQGFELQHAADFRRVKQFRNIKKELHEIEQLDDPAQRRRRLEALGMPREQLMSIATTNDPLEVAPALRETYRRLAPMLSDPLRSVRTEAARVLSYFPREAFTKEDRRAMDAALDEYITGLENLSDQAGAHLRMAVLYENLGDPDRAKQEYLTAIRLDPRFFQARVNLAMLYAAGGQRAEAVKLFRQAIDSQRELLAELELHALDATELELILADTHYSLGLLLAEEKDRLEEAVKELAEAVRLAPNNARMHYNHAVALHQLGRLNEAEQSYRAAYKLAPQVSDYLVVLTNLYAQQERWDRAVQCAEELVRQQPDNPQMQALLRYVKQEAEGNDK